MPCELSHTGQNALSCFDQPWPFYRGYALTNSPSLFTSKRIFCHAYGHSRLGLLGLATWRRRVAESNPFQILMPHEAEQ